MHRAVALVVLLLTVLNEIYSQSAIVKGTITDLASKQTLIGVNVVLEDNTGVASDFNGNYELKCSSGQHTITYKFIGYKPITRQVTLAEGETQTVNITMEEAITELGVVVVSAGKFEQKIEDVTVSMAVIKPALLENKASNNIDVAVNQTPGVQVVDNEPQIRGGSGYSFGAGSRVMVMVDDLPALSGDAGRPKWSFLPIENLEQMEVLKGASSVLYGSAALSGVINIRTAYPKDKPETKVNINAGVYDYPRNKAAVYYGNNNPTVVGTNFFHSRKAGNLDIVIGGNAFSDQGYVGPTPTDYKLKHVKSSSDDYYLSGGTKGDTVRWTGKDTTIRDLSQTMGQFEKRGRMNLNLRYRPKSIEGLNFGVNFNGMRSESTSALIMLNTEEGMYRTFPGSLTRTIATNFNVDPFVNYFGKHGGKHMIRTRVYYEDNANNNGQANKSVLYYGEYQFSKAFEKIKGLNATVGVMTSAAEAEASLYSGNENGDGISNAMNNAAYLQLDKKFWERLTLSAGARYERYQVNSVSAEQPVFRGGASVKVFKGTFVRGSWGQGFRVPTIAEKYIYTTVGSISIYPSVNLEPERSWNTEFGILQQFKLGELKGSIDVAAFKQEIQNTIEYTFGVWNDPKNPTKIAPGFRSLNIGTATIQGIDASVITLGKLGEFEITTMIGYTYIQPFIKDTGYVYERMVTGGKTSVVTYGISSSDSSGIMKYRFEHMVKGDVQLGFRKLGLGASYRYLSFMKNIDNVFLVLDKTPILPTGLTKYREERNGKGDGIWDLRVSYKATDHIRIAFLVNNALNHEYMIRPLAMEEPRTFNVQYSMSF